VRRVTCAGTRAAELAVRLKYAGVDPARIAVREDLAGALQDAAADRPPAADGQPDTNSPLVIDGQPDSNSPLATDGQPDTDSPPPLYVLPTYTAMLSLRELLVARGEARSAWS
jgi:hypothetical protein